MTPQQRRKLEKLLKTLEDGRMLIRELLQETNVPDEHGALVDFDARGRLQSLKALGREAAERQLGEMRQHELGAVFVESGGPLADRKKPKVWLVEQILWRVFDFERGHEAIRSKGASETN